jgi:hypothetical protein
MLRRNDSSEMLESLFSHARFPSLSYGNKSDEVLNLEQVWGKVGLGTVDPNGLVEQEDWYRQKEPKNIKGFTSTLSDELQVVNEVFQLVNRAIAVAPQLVDLRFSLPEGTLNDEKKMLFFQLLGLDKEKIERLVGEGEEKGEIWKLDDKYNFRKALNEIISKNDLTSSVEMKQLEDRLEDRYEAVTKSIKEHYAAETKKINEKYAAAGEKKQEQKNIDELKKNEKAMLEDLEKKKEKKEVQTGVLLMANEIVKKINAKILLSYELQRELESLKNKIVQVALDNVNLLLEVMEVMAKENLTHKEDLEFFKKLMLPLFKDNKSLLLETVAFLKVLATEVVKRREPLKISATAQPGSQTEEKPIVSTFTSSSSHDDFTNGNSGSNNNNDYNNKGGASQANIDLLNALSYEQNRLNSVNAMIGGKYMK